MSEPSSASAKTPKTMSSKLLTMKFMQRAAASSPLSTPSTPDQPSPKRQRIGDLSSASINVTSGADQIATQAALAAEEAKRQLVLERQAADAGDTRWVLTFRPDINSLHIQAKTALRVVATGFAAIDHAQLEKTTPSYGEDMDLDHPFIVGRRSFGKFNRTIEKLQDPSNVDASESETDEHSGEQSGNDSEDSEDDDPHGTNALIKAAQEAVASRAKSERKEKRKAERAKLLRLAEKRKRKEVKLNELTSISGSSASKGPTCYRCGKPGHLQGDCPKRENSGGRDEAGGVIRSKKLKKS